MNINPSTTENTSVAATTATTKGPRQSSRYDHSHDQLASHVAKQYPEQPKFRVNQLWHALYADVLDPHEITTLPSALRSSLSADPALQRALTLSHESLADNGLTKKWLFRLTDNASIETVLMHYTDRTTLCISSQAGCAMNCSFCATGQLGFGRHLSAGEIVEQVVFAEQRLRRAGDAGLSTTGSAPQPQILEKGEHAITNIVFMGMGEPLANFANMWEAIDRLHCDLGFGARRITVSTVGIIPGMAKLREKQLRVNLAVSLHAANDELRTKLVPINARYPIRELVAECRRYVDATGRRISFEWALIHETNDSMHDAHELANLALPLGAHVNVIPLNPTPGFLAQGPPEARVEQFLNTLTALGVNVTRRDTRGSSIDAACGQLASRVTNANQNR